MSYFNGKNKDEFLSLCEEEFKNRFTESDKEFSSYIAKPLKSPPVLEMPQRTSNMFHNRHRSRESYDRSRESYDRSRESYDRSRESYDRSRESYDRDKEITDQGHHAAAQGHLTGNTINRVYQGKSLCDCWICYLVYCTPTHYLSRYSLCSTKITLSLLYTMRFWLIFSDLPSSFHLGISI
ncbi:hypothetical protein EB796_008233 [Bugula neritina]|uniref:Uncharacterized protein n=1 Tax=Bugula neritina TaxID=10212 RepID=A0A7J7K4A1_BUGNE|nr:hypothetical protein EB796_008233 [Bugula neritina]